MRSTTRAGWAVPGGFMRLERLGLVAAGLLLAGCVTYQPRTLPGKPRWVAAPAGAARQGSPALDLARASRLALRGNPAYRVALLQARVSDLDLRAAGLLPDPQISATADHPTTPGYSQAWSLGFAEDLGGLLTRGAMLDAARANHAERVLQVAWQGWLLSQRTADDYIDRWAARRRVVLLRRQVREARQRERAFSRALDRRDVTLESAAASLVTLAGAQSQLASAEQAAATAGAALDADLGVAPRTRFALSEPTPPPLPSRRQLDAALAALPRTRPDLLALRAAARARDAEFRAAVLAQFPGITVAVNRASDTSRVQSTGLGISLALPLLGGAQARARIAGATRDAAYAQYQARLDAATRAATALDVQLRLIRAQRLQLAEWLPRLRTLAAHADRAFAAGALDGTTWASVQQNLIARELEFINLTADLNKGQVDLATLLGQVPPDAGVPPAGLAGSTP